jgi:hypothetical protein
MTSLCHVTALFFALAMYAALADFRVPTVLKAEPARELSRRFAGMEGWTGGDGVYSVQVAPRRVLWFFGDTILGKVKDGRRVDAIMVNNTVGVQTGPAKDAAIRFVAGRDKDSKPTAVFLPTDGKGWFWPLAPVMVRQSLIVFLTQIEKAGDGPFGFKQIGQVLAVVENPEDEPEKWRVQQHRVPFSKEEASGERSWGAAALVKDGYLYVYGCDEPKRKGPTTKHMVLARVAIEHVEDFTAWRFRTPDGWSARPDDAARIASRVANEYTVTPLPDGDGYVAVCSENGLSDRIVAHFARAPEGPWSDATLLYKSPEMKADKGLMTYAAKAHAWAAEGNELVVSYCVNPWQFGRLFEDEKLYRPKFVRVKLGPGK